MEKIFGIALEQNVRPRETLTNTKVYKMLSFFAIQSLKIPVVNFDLIDLQKKN